MLKTLYAFLLRKVELMFRIKKSDHTEPKINGEPSFFVHVRELEDSVVSQEVNHIRASAAISALFGSFLLSFLLSDKRYTIINQFKFLLVSVLYCALEVIKYVIYCYKTGKKVSVVHFQNVRNLIKTYVVVLACSYVITVLFGADLFNNIAATFIFCCHSSTFILIPFCFYTGERCLHIIVREERPKNLIECSILFVSASVIVGAWLGAFVIPLDWDSDWQIWPISCVIGTILGFMIGNLFLLICTFVNSYYLYQMFLILK